VRTDIYSRREKGRTDRNSVESRDVESLLNAGHELTNEHTGDHEEEDERREHAIEEA
jgi:hypothetical protein